MRETNLPNKWHRISIIEFNCFWMSRAESQPGRLTLTIYLIRSLRKMGIWCLTPMEFAADCGDVTEMRVPLQS